MSHYPNIKFEDELPEGWVKLQHILRALAMGSCGAIDLDPSVGLAISEIVRLKLTFHEQLPD